MDTIRAGTGSLNVDGRVTVSASRAEAQQGKPAGVQAMLHPAIDSRYAIQETLGRGATSTVFRATDLAIGRDVVLKAIHLNAPGSPSLARVRREAQLYGAVQHPLIVTLYDVLQAEPDVVLVMQYVDGSDLRRLLSRTNLSIRAAIQIAADVGDALAHLHKNRVIHRDIKPSNLIVRDVHDHSAIVTEQNRTMIADLGIGKQIDNEGSEPELITADGSLVGTIAYMSPEQLTGAQASTASDVYGVGTVLYEMVAGQLPFAATTLPETLKRITSERLPSVNSFRAACPTAVAVILEELLAKNPNDRPNMEVAAIELRSILDSTDWEGVARSDAKRIEAGRGRPTSVPLDVLRTKFDDRSTVVVTGFFATDNARFQEFSRSVEFYRTHLDEDYKSLLAQAKVAFILWLVCAATGFIVLAVGIALVYWGALAAGGLTIASDCVVLFLQRVFKQREDHYRALADEKHRHLRFGDLWNLALQSADGLGDASKRTQKLGELLDALIDMLRSTGHPVTTPSTSQASSARNSNVAVP